ncbi:MAG: hypothetical protein IRY99_13485 [Isosphaeraceae bacterium]|nr:hypothetical protein [Isosphaeraceae bacterium]
MPDSSHPLAAEPSNPYAAPSAGVGRAIDLEAVGTDAEVEAVRRAHIGREVAIKVVGVLHYIAAGLGLLIGVIAAGVLLVGVATGFAILNERERSQPIPFLVSITMIAAFYLPIGGINLAIGLGLRRFQPWARWACTALMILCVIVATLVGLLASLSEGPLLGLGVFAIYSLVPTLITLLLAIPGTAMIFSPYYRMIIARTPHIRYKMGPGWRIAILLLVAAALGGVAVIASQ